MERHKLKTGIIFVVISCVIRLGLSMTMLTGGKSHIQIQNVSDQQSTRSTPAAFGLHTRTTRKVFFRRSVEDLSDQQFRNPVDVKGVVQIRPEIIGKSPPTFARLLSSSSYSPQLLESGNALTLTADTLDRKKRRALSDSAIANHSQSGGECVTNIPACMDVPFEALVPHAQQLLAFKNGKIHTLSSAGDIVMPKPVPAQTVFPGIPNNVTGALRMKDHTYIFFGTTYMKFRSLRRPVYAKPVPIPSGFHGVPIPVNAVFQLNSHTYVFITGTKFVFYQPDAEPPVNPLYSPNAISKIVGGPAEVSAAFNTPDGRRFLLSQDELMYELNDKMQVIHVQPFKRGPDGKGWLNCTPRKSSSCSTEGLNHGITGMTSLLPNTPLTTNSTTLHSIFNATATTAAATTTPGSSFQSSPQTTEVSTTAAETTSAFPFLSTSTQDFPTSTTSVAINITQFPLSIDSTSSTLDPLLSFDDERTNQQVTFVVENAATVQTFPSDIFAPSNSTTLPEQQTGVTESSLITDMDEQTNGSFSVVPTVTISALDTTANFTLTVEEIAALDQMRFELRNETSTKKRRRRKTTTPVTALPLLTVSDHSTDPMPEPSIKLPPSLSGTLKDQLDFQGQVLQELMSKLNNLTQVISSLSDLDGIAITANNNNRTSKLRALPDIFL